MAGVLQEAGTTYHLRAHGFTTGFLMGVDVPHLFSFLFCVVCVCRLVCLRSVSCVPNVTNFSGLSILDFPIIVL